LEFSVVHWKRCVRDQFRILTFKLPALRRRMRLKWDVY
jgi:hypothetical protein